MHIIVIPMPCRYLTWLLTSCGCTEIAIRPTSSNQKKYFDQLRINLKPDHYICQINQLKIQ